MTKSLHLRWSAKDLAAWPRSAHLITTFRHSSRSFLEAKEKWGEDPPKPGHWGGYSLNPDSIEFWQSLLGLGNWQINTIRISEMQVIDDHYGDIPGHEFVGVTIDNEFLRATIYHTRSIFEDDIIHELLHVRFQEWSEEEVVHSTNKLQGLDNPISFITQLS